MRNVLLNKPLIWQHHYKVLLTSYENQYYSHESLIDQANDIVGVCLIIQVLECVTHIIFYDVSSVKIIRTPQKNNLYRYDQSYVALHFLPDKSHSRVHLYYFSQP